MGRGRKPGLKVTRTIPVLTHEERAKRIEYFYDTLMEVNKVEGYRGCTVDSEKNIIWVYVD